MLMGRDQMAVLHSFFIKELCKILQLHLATQKDTSLLHFLLKCRYFLPLKGFCGADSDAFAWVSFCSMLPGREGKDKGVDEDILGCFHSPGLSPSVWSSKQSRAREGQPRSPKAAPKQSQGVTPRECHKPQPDSAGFTKQVQRNRGMTIGNHRKIAICCTT